MVRAIHHAHQRGVLHRDVKPGNILLDNAGEPHVTDFGLAKFTERESDLTMTHAALGTPAYMSPEQAAGQVKKITTATDIYGLGAVLFEMLTGKAPFTGETPMAIARQVIEQEPPEPSSIHSAVPPELAAVCLKCLEKDPARRYTSARALAEELEHWLRHEPISAHAATPWERACKWVRRKPIHAALGATVVFAAMTLLGILLWDNRRVHLAQRATRAVNQELAAHLRQVEWQQAEDLLRARNTADAVAMFARFLRETPNDLAVVSRLVSLLEMRAFPLPALPPFKHERPVNLARMERSGQHVLTVADDGVLRSWSLVNGSLERQAALNLGHDYFLLLPDGQRLLAATKEGQVILWNFRRWEKERELGEVRPFPRRLGMSEDGRLVSLETSRHQLELWETTSGKMLSSTNLADGDVYLSVEAGPNGETVVQGQLRGVWLWRPLKQEFISLLSTNEGAVYSACDWPRKRVFISLERTHGTTQGLVSLDLETGRELLRRPEAVPWHTLQISPDGKQLLGSRWVEGANVLNADTLSEQLPSFGQASVPANISPDGAFRLGFRAFPDGSGRLYDLSNGQALTEPIQHEGFISSHQLSPDGSHVITASQDGTARLWDLRMRSSDPIYVRMPGWISALVLSPDKQRLAVAADRQARIFDLGTAKPLIPPITLGDAIFKVNFSPDGTELVGACWDSTVRVWNTGTAAPGFVARHERRVWLAVFSPDARSIASAGEDSTARVFDAKTGRALFAPIRHEGGVSAVTFSPNGALLATSSEDTTARLWNAATGAPAGPALRHQGTVWTVEFSGDGNRLLTASADRTAQVWEVLTGKPAAPAIRSDQSILGATFSQDGRRVLINTLNSARIFNARTSEPLTPSMRHASRVAQARFSPDGRWVATSCEDGTARIWDAQTGYPVTEALPHRGIVSRILWLPDSRRILAGGQDGAVRIWKRPEFDSAPLWLPDLAEALAGKRDDGKGGRVAISSERLAALREFAEKGNDDTPQLRWLRWFLIERLRD